MTHYLRYDLVIPWTRGGRAPGTLGQSTAGVVGVMGIHLGVHSPRVRGPKHLVRMLPCTLRSWPTSMALLWLLNMAG